MRRAKQGADSGQTECVQMTDGSDRDSLIIFFDFFPGKGEQSFSGIVHQVSREEKVLSRDTLVDKAVIFFSHGVRGNVADTSFD